MKTNLILTVALILAILGFFYTSFVPGSAKQTFLSSPEATTWERWEGTRNGLFFTSLVGFFLAAGMAPWKRKLSLIVWATVILLVGVRAFIPAYPSPPGFPFASSVFWAILGLQSYLCWLSFEALKCKKEN